jgi:hypothetical protein
MEAYKNINSADHDTDDMRGEKMEEDKCMLRIRTRQLFSMLMKNHSSEQQTLNTVVTLVTHKGYLRELERGLFQQPTATEFQNGEIRLYQITFHTGTSSMKYAERIL